jgi:carboxymethylenebutenolidase
MKTRYTVTEEIFQMADDTKDHKDNDASSSGLPRRDFVMSVAAGFAAAGSAGAATSVVETDVEIKTPDGTCDAAFIHPSNGSHAGVLLWTDAF